MKKEFKNISVRFLGVAEDIVTASTIGVSTTPVSGQPGEIIQAGAPEVSGKPQFEN